jgi:hypothetical protein
LQDAEDLCAKKISHLFLQLKPVQGHPRWVSIEQRALASVFGQRTRTEGVFLLASGKKGDRCKLRKLPLPLIIKAKAKCRSLERYLQRTPVPPAADGAWINAAVLFWHGHPQDLDLEVYQQLSASVYDALVYYIADAKVAHVLSGVPADAGAALLKKLRSAEGSTRQQVLNLNEATRSENLPSDQDQGRHAQPIDIRWHRARVH